MLRKMIELKNLCFVVVLGLSIIQVSVGFSCFKCASSAKVLDMWHLTGYTHRLTRDDITNRCINPTEENKKAPEFSSCSVACVTIIFDDPDQIANKEADSNDSSNSEYLFIRGCLEDLLGYMPADTGNLIPATKDDAAKCLGGTMKMSLSVHDNTASTANIRFNQILCKSAPGSNCNDKTTLQTIPTKCKDTPSLKQCYECISEKGKNCKTGTSNASPFCYKIDAQFGNKDMIIKGGSPINPFLDNTCHKFASAIAALPRAYIPIYGKVCYCSGTAAYCNGAERKVAGGFLAACLSLGITLLLMT